MNAASKSFHAIPQHLPRQRGASLLEGIAYLGIAAIVILGAVSLLTGAFGSAESNRTSEEVTAIRTAARKLYMGQGYGTASMNAPLATAGAFPGTLTINSTSGAVTNGWNGAVTVTGAGGTFTIEYAAVPQDVCISTLVSAAGWQSIKAGTASITSFPVSPTTAQTSCAGTGTTGNDLTFTSI
jgi:hypothetical protein